MDTVWFWGGICVLRLHSFVSSYFRQAHRVWCIVLFSGSSGWSAEYMLFSWLIVRSVVYSLGSVTITYLLVL